MKKIRFLNFSKSFSFVRQLLVVVRSIWTLNHVETPVWLPIPVNRRIKTRLLRLWLRVEQYLLTEKHKRSSCLWLIFWLRWVIILQIKKWKDLVRVASWFHEMGFENVYVYLKPYRWWIVVAIAWRFGGSSGSHIAVVEQLLNVLLSLRRRFLDRCPIHALTCMDIVASHRHS